MSFMVLFSNSNPSPPKLDLSPGGCGTNGCTSGGMGSAVRFFFHADPTDSDWYRVIVVNLSWYYLILYLYYIYIYKYYNYHLIYTISKKILYEYLRKQFVSVDTKKHTFSVSIHYNNHIVFGWVLMAGPSLGSAVNNGVVVMLLTHMCSVQ